MNKWSYTYTTFGYLGFFIFTRFTFSFLSRIVKKIRAPTLDQYKVENLTFPSEIQLPLDKNYVFLNWDAIKNNYEFCKQLIKLGYSLLLLRSKDKESSIDLDKLQLIKSDSTEIKYIIYDKRWNELEFESNISNVLENYKINNFNICLYINKFKNSLSLTKQINLLKICISKMLVKRGKSLVLGLANSSSELCGNEFMQKLHWSLSTEYNEKIDFIFTKTHCPKHTELNFLNLETMDIYDIKFNLGKSFLGKIKEIFLFLFSISYN